MENQNTNSNGLPNNQGMPMPGPQPAPQSTPVNQPNYQGQPMQQPQVQQQAAPIQQNNNPAFAQPTQQGQAFASGQVSNPVMQQGQPMQQQFQQQPNFQQSQPTQNRPMQQPGQPMMPGQRPMPRTTVPGGPNPKRLILGCLGFFFFSVILFVLFVIAFVSQTSASGENGLASALGVNPAEFTNTLILMTNLIFGVVVMITFFVSVFGLFRAGMSPKTDKVARSSGYKQAGIAGIILLIMTMLWVFVYIYLSGKKVDIAPKQNTTTGIITEPEVTTKLVAPVDVKFDATKIPYNPSRIEITFYQWDFGDGGSSTSPTVTHTYREVGQYNVKLTVTARDKTNNQTVTQNFDKLVTVSDVKVTADFSASPESGPAPLKVDFDASSSSSPAGEITAYEWDFKGQNSFRDATGEKVSYTFDREGDYQVKLRITDNKGQSATVTKTISAGGPDLPVADIDIPTDSGKYFVSKQLTFLGEKSTTPNGEIKKYEWDFGDGSPKATTRTATHTYKTAGLYEVILRVTDSDGKIGTNSQKIKLEVAESAPEAVITTQPAINDKDKTLAGQVPFTVNFSADQSIDSDNNIVEYKWDFDGDDKIDAAGANVSYVYKTAGSYNASLTAIDSANNQSTATLVVNVAAQDLTARLTADKVEGNSPLTVTLDATSSSYPDGQITSYEWDFGDGSAKRIDAAKVSYKYESIGTFKASVVAKASDGKTDSAEIIINVRPIALQACYTPDVEEGPAPLTIELDPRCSQGAVSKYLWDFGDGETSRTRKPTHTFDKPGSYKVTLEVTDNQNVVNTFSKNILVTGEVTP